MLFDARGRRCREKGEGMNREGKGRVIYWGSVFCETDFFGAWVWAKVRPEWYWFLSRAWLFVRIVWRVHETSRMDWRTAWEVAKVGKGLSRVRVAGRVLDGRIWDGLAWQGGGS